MAMPCHAMPCMPWMAYMAYLAYGIYAIYAISAIYARCAIYAGYAISAIYAMDGMALAWHDTKRRPKRMMVYVSRYHAMGGGVRWKELHACVL